MTRSRSKRKPAAVTETAPGGAGEQATVGVVGNEIRREAARRNAGTRRLTVALTEPAVPILLLAGIVEVMRAATADILVFFGTITILIVDAPRWQWRVHDAEPEPPGRADVLAVLAIAAAYGVSVGQLSRRSWWLDAALAVTGVVALWLALFPRQDAHEARTGRHDVEPATRTRAPARWWIWPVLGVGAALIELYSFLSQPDPRTDSPDHPTVSTLVEPRLDNPLLRAAVLSLWLLAGWWLLRRIRVWMVGQ